MKPFIVEQTNLSSFFAGWGRLLDTSGSIDLYDGSGYLSALESIADEEIDALFLARDWKNIGNDIWLSLDKFSEENKLKSPSEIQLLLPLDR